MKNKFLFTVFGILLTGIAFSQTFTWTPVVTSYTSGQGIVFDTNDSLWFAGYNGLFEKDGASIIDHSAGFVTTSLTSCEARGNIIWTGGYGGLIQYNGTPTNYSNPGDLQGSAIYDVDVTGNNIWLAMENEGASHYNGSTWTHYDSSDSLIGDWFQSIEQDNIGNVWLGSSSYSTSKGTIYKFNGSTWTSYSTAQGMILGDVSSVFSASNGDLWAGGTGGLMKFNGTTWTMIDTSVVPACIKEDASGNIWYGCSYDVVKMYDGSTIYNTNAPANFTGRCDGIAMSAQGELYFCLDSGIYKVDYTPSTGIHQEFADNHMISVYPNPASDKINIEFENEEEMVKFTLFDLAGRIQMEVTGDHKTILLEHLNSGLYSYIIQTRSNTYSGNISILL